MAKQALKEEFEFPAGGIADFYMEDHEIEALERAEAEEEFGSAGIATFQPIANRMASYGRYGDDTVAHVETGELIVPKALIDQNPKLKASIFNHLRELGVEDPERYVVGSGVNSINPETGMPEFFLKKIFRGVKKAASKIARGVKKGLKSVGKVLKKAAPIVLPIALSFTPLGAIYGAALGSGIGSLIQGKSLKDSLKSALIAGATGALFKGFQGKGTFMENVTAEAANPMGRISETATNIGEGKLFGTFSGGTSAPGDTTNIAEASVSGESTQAGSSVDAFKADGLKAQKVALTPDEIVTQATGDPVGLGQADPAAGTYNTLGSTPPASTTQTFTVADQAALEAAAQPPGFVDSAKNLYQDPSLANLKELTFGAEPKTASEILAKAGYNPATVSAESALGKAAQKAAEESAGTLFRNYAVPATVGTVAAGYGLSKMLPGGEPEDEPTIEELQGPTGSDLIAEDPGRYLVTGNTESPMTSTGQYVVGTDYAYDPLDYFNQNPFLRPGALAARPIQAVADGGEIFPRRVGGIMPDEGIPGQDSVRAMLMPGEFVMTTNAVKGLGNGNNQVGINRMYDMMRGLEARGKAMA
jgi:hypothetical protein